MKVVDRHWSWFKVIFKLYRVSASCAVSCAAVPSTCYASACCNRNKFASLFILPCHFTASRRPAFSILLSPSRNCNDIKMHIKIINSNRAVYGCCRVSLLSRQYHGAPWATCGNQVNIIYAWYHINTNEEERLLLAKRSSYALADSYLHLWFVYLIYIIYNII